MENGVGSYLLFDLNGFYCRRLLLTADPEWPAIKVSATLESLSVHVSELKISQLQHCLKMLSAGDSGSTDSQSPPKTRQSESPTDEPRMTHSQSRFVYIYLFPYFLHT